MRELWTDWLPTKRCFPPRLGHVDPRLSWTKDAANPITYTNGSDHTLTTPYDTPGQIWKSNDHWNYLVMGQVRTFLPVRPLEAL